MNLYLDNGYLNMPGIIESDFPFIFIASARGTGKTYGALRYFVEHETPIIHLRRTQKESDLQNTTAGSSYKSVMEDLDREYSVEASHNLGTVYDSEGNTLAYNMALNTFSSVRGMDFSNINYVFFDEFIAEPHVRKIKAEGFSLANFYESVNRNRELNGRQPLKLICGANSVNMANDIFLYFDLIQEAESMLKAGEEIREIDNKLLIIPQNSPISMQKKETALYKAVNKEFSEMAIKNKFILNDTIYVKKRPVTEYRCIMQIGDLYLYEHKSRAEFYITFQNGKCKTKYGNGYADRQRARRSLWKYVQYYMDGYIRFESFNCIALFEKYFDL